MSAESKVWQQHKGESNTTPKEGLREAPRKEEIVTLHCKSSNKDRSLFSLAYKNLSYTAMQRTGRFASNCVYGNIRLI
eukprot:1161577-Pelagomonas_calceolata.AAC.1